MGGRRVEPSGARVDRILLDLRHWLLEEMWRLSTTRVRKTSTSNSTSYSRGNAAALKRRSCAPCHHGASEHYAANNRNARKIGAFLAFVHSAFAHSPGTNSSLAAYSHGTGQPRKNFTCVRYACSLSLLNVWACAIVDQGSSSQNSCNGQRSALSVLFYFVVLAKLFEILFIFFFLPIIYKHFN